MKTATNSRFDETLYSPVNKKFFPDEYENWRDTVAQSLAHGGRPLDYQQVFTASWDIPINKFPGLDFITAKAQYSATYNWDTGVEYADGMTLGNTISNLAMWQADGQMNFETLYNKSKYLKQINQKFASRKTTRRQTKFTPKKFSQTVNLTDSANLKVTHRLNSDNFDIIFTDASGKLVKVKYKILDKNNIELVGKTNINRLKVAMETRNPNVEKPAKATTKAMISRLEISFLVFIITSINLIIQLYLEHIDL